MNTVMLEGELIKSVAEFHYSIKPLLDFPDYYGNNLDALWDCITSIETPIRIIWQDHLISKSYLGDYFNKIVELFDDASKKLNFYSIELIVVYK